MTQLKGGKVEFGAPSLSINDRAKPEEKAPEIKKESGDAESKDGSKDGEDPSR